MQDLTLVGLNEDGSRLVLVGDAGEEYSVPADSRLRELLRDHDARLARLEKRMESALRPRDIQARIRAGESPESVAEAAQTTVDRIMGFATPVLAERAHIAQRAQQSSVRRKGGEGPSRVLGETVTRHLRERNVDPESVDWDAWRREDGRWTLVAAYSGAGESNHATFTFDVPGRYVVPEDDEARRLVGEQTRQEPRGRLSSVGAEDELTLGDDAIDLVTGRSGPADLEPTIDLTEARVGVRTHRPAGVEPTAETADADWMATQASERPVRRVEPAAARSDRPEQPEQPEQPELPEEPDQPELPELSGPDEQSDATGEEQPPQRPAPARKPARKRGRASVPSWDEIMFGGGRSE